MQNVTIMIKGASRELVADLSELLELAAERGSLADYRVSASHQQPEPEPTAAAEPEQPADIGDGDLEPVSGDALGAFIDSTSSRH